MGEPRPLDGQPDLEDVPPVPPRPAAADNAAQNARNQLHFMRWPITFKADMDVELFLRRFNSYVQAIGAVADEIPNMLITCLDDEVLRNIERHLREDITYQELVAILRREMGMDRANRENDRAKLRRTMRGRNEKIRPFYVKLYGYAHKAYENQQVRDANLRDAFISNLQDSQISARLRENPQLTNEEVLELAVTLMNCKNASLPRSSNVLDVNVLTSEIEEQDQSKLDQILLLLKSTSVNAAEQNSPYPSNQYRYSGNRQSAGLNLDTVANNVPYQNTATNVPYQNIANNVPYQNTATNVPYQNTATNVSYQNTDTNVPYQNTGSDYRGFSNYNYNQNRQSGQNYRPNSNFYNSNFNGRGPRRGQGFLNSRPRFTNSYNSNYNNNYRQNFRRFPNQGPPRGFNRFPQRGMGHYNFSNQRFPNNNF